MGQNVDPSQFAGGANYAFSVVIIIIIIIIINLLLSLLSLFIIIAVANVFAVLQQQ